MTTKQIITITLLGVILQGCTTYKSEYDNQSFFGINPNYATSAERDNNSVYRTQNPMARPSYEEYQESIKDKVFEPK